MIQTTFSYRDPEVQLDLDDAIYEIGRRHAGEKAGRRYCECCGWHEFEIDFPDEDKRTAAWGAYMRAAVRDYASVEVSCSHGRDSRDAPTELIVEFNPDREELLRQIASLLTEDVCSGWSRLGDEGYAISVWCWSPQAARFLVWQIQRGPLQPFVYASLSDGQGTAFHASQPDRTTFFIDAHYDNSDGQCCCDGTIKSAIEDHGGTMEAAYQSSANCRQTITGVFASYPEARETVEALEAIGIEAKAYRDAPIEAIDDAELNALHEGADPSSYLVVDFEPEETRLRREIVRLLTFDLVYGWYHCDWGRFLVACKSEEAAMTLRDKIEDSQVGYASEGSSIDDFRVLRRTRRR